MGRAAARTEEERVDGLATRRQRAIEAMADVSVVGVD